jgi:outer membrane protein TolC
VSFSGQATYQSQTVSFGDAIGAMPGINFPQISKDQYKIQGDVNQLIYDGGATSNQKESIKANAALQAQNIETNLYNIQQKINSIYFAILLLEAQKNQNEINKENLVEQLKKAEAALKYGTAYQSTVNELKAEILTKDMQSTDYNNNRIAYLNMLALFIGKNLSENTDLKTPNPNFENQNINRPELKTFDFQKALYDVQEKQMKTEYLPQVSAFFQGAYGRPTLNIIENKFGPWFVTGLRFTWQLGSLYTLSNRKEMLNLNREMVDSDREAFLLNTHLDLKQQNQQIINYQELLSKDDEVINLRSSVVKSAQAQLANGVITVHEYIQKVNAEDLAKQTKILHEIQLLQAKYNQKYITGN